MKRLRACVLGATGIVGQHFISVLDNHPYFETVLTTGSERSAGKEYGSVVDWVMNDRILSTVRGLRVVPTEAEQLLEADVDLAFSALPANIAASVEEEVAGAGIPVFSNAGAHRMREDVPILIPEINPDHLSLVTHQPYDNGFIVTNSNCSTSGLVFGLAPLKQFGILSVIVTTYQAVSGAGRYGVPSLDILGNVVPFISNEEGKMETEVKKILGEFDGESVRHADFEVNASCARVPVIDGHLESIVVKFQQDITEQEAVGVFQEYTGEPQRLDLPTAPSRPVQVLSERDRPQPKRDLTVSAEDVGMSVKIGRVRKKGSRLNFYLLVHNAYRGAAAASVLNAEYALATGYLGKGGVTT